MMDNFLIDIKAQGDQQLTRALAICLDCNAPGGKATHYSVDEEYGLILYWHENSKQTPLPYSLSSETAGEFVWNWLEGTDMAHKDFLDHDGSMGTGFRVFCEAWGHVNKNHYAICAVYPIYAWYGK